MYGRSENPLTYCAGCWINGKIGPLLFAPSLRYQAWRFFSYQFVHQGFIFVVQIGMVEIISETKFKLIQFSNSNMQTNLTIF